MTILYWQVYKNLEKEFLGLADVIHVDDKQLEVYSMKIADLLIILILFSKGHYNQENLHKAFQELIEINFYN